MILSYSALHDHSRNYLRNTQALMRSQHNLALICLSFVFQNLYILFIQSSMFLYSKQLSLVPSLNNLIHHLYQLLLIVRSNMKSHRLLTQKLIVNKYKSFSTRLSSQAMKTQKTNLSSYLCHRLTFKTSETSAS